MIINVKNILVGITVTISVKAFAYEKVVQTYKSGKPNVVLVIVDDMGYGDLSCLGNPYLQTPQIDNFYKQSIRLTNFHVDPTCAPTRASLLTGKYSSKVGVWHTLQGRSYLDKDQVTLAQIFEENGYKTGLFGKWHLGDNYPYRPQDRGFQETVSFGGGGVGQIGDFWRNDYFDDIYLHNGEHEFYKGYCTDVWFNNAVKFIEKNKDNPFFCYVATNAPHYKYNVPNNYTLALREQGLPDDLARYLGMIANIDENMGKLINKMKNLSLIEKTIFIFMSDNGKSSIKLPKPGEPFYFNAGMRGLKASSYEGGHRVIFFIHWPAGGLQGGRDLKQLTAGFDIMPTLINLCQLSNKHQIAFDGKSIVPLLKNNNTQWDERTIIVQNQRVETPVKWRNCAVMTNEYRLINGKELYDIKKDSGQEINIALANPDVVQQLRKQYDDWWKTISIGFDKYTRFYLGDEHENPTALICLDWHSDTALKTYDPEVIRQRQQTNGFWAVEVVKDGEYEFTCRTYPKEEDTRLDVVKVRVKVGKQEVEKECDPGASEVKVKLNLKAGEAMMQTWFYQKDGENYGVPFVYVKRL